MTEYYIPIKQPSIRVINSLILGFLSMHINVERQCVSIFQAGQPLAARLICGVPSEQKTTCSLIGEV